MWLPRIAGWLGEQLTMLTQHSPELLWFRWLLDDEEPGHRITELGHNEVILGDQVHNGNIGHKDSVIGHWYEEEDKVLADPDAFIYPHEANPQAKESPGKELPQVISVWVKQGKPFEEDAAPVGIPEPEQVMDLEEKEHEEEGDDDAAAQRAAFQVMEVPEPHDEEPCDSHIMYLVQPEEAVESLEAHDKSKGEDGSPQQPIHVSGVQRVNGGEGSFQVGPVNGGEVGL